MSESYADIANKAADHMERVGSQSGELWHRHVNGEAYNGAEVCMVGALRVAEGMTLANGDKDYRTDVVLALADFVPKPSFFCASYNGFAVSCYNDTHTHKQRVQMLRDFATKHESDEFRSAGNDTV